MALTIKEVECVAMLARLALSEEEKQPLAEQLGSILDYANMLEQLDTEGVEPLAHLLPVYNVLRPDQIKPASSREEMLANAPQVEEGQYKVPRII